MSKILVIGESCKDVFLYCSSERLCPDVPVPILNIQKKIENEGMAQNVYRNIKNIISSCDIVTNFNWRDIKKTRYVDEASNHMFIRVDDDHSQIPKLDLSSVDFKSYDLIAISDYNKGYLTIEDISYICENHDNVFLDTKKKLGKWADKARFIKINNYELQRSLDTISEIALSKTICTKGGDGCDYNGVNYPVNPTEIKDSSGAGDTFFAALVCEFLKSNNIDKSINYANKCASKVVAERGVTTL
jgi:bifunctional ADP-heptose synthase (sugar kinase/adenylyltransferase)